MTRNPTRTLAAFAAGIAMTAASAFTFQAMSVNAVDDDEATYVPTSPCRLFDFRPDPDNVGPRDTPLGADETDEVQVTGMEGNCDIPADATAISMNVTALNATAPSFLQVWPADEAQPGQGSSLNYLPGQAPTPNKVDVKLSPTGAINVYNLAGTVDVLGDVVGYYTNSGLQGLEARLASLEAQQAFTVATEFDSGLPLIGGGGSQPVAAIEVEAPVDGHVFVHASGALFSTNGDTTIECGITSPGPIAPESGFNTFWKGSEANDSASLSVNRVFEIEAGETVVYYLTCESDSAIATADFVLSRQIGATFTADVPGSGIVISP